MKSDVNSGILFPFKSTPSEPKNFQEKAGQSIAPKHQDYEQLVSTSPDDSEVGPLKKPPLHTFGTKPNLPNISVSRHAPGLSMSSDSVTGFNFPVTSSSSTLSEPTPSVKPFSSGRLICQPKDSLAIPSYNFGSNKSTLCLACSFPSTSNPLAHDLNSTSNLMRSRGYPLVQSAKMLSTTKHGFIITGTS